MYTCAHVCSGEGGSAELCVSVGTLSPCQDRPRWDCAGRVAECGASCVRLLGQLGESQDWGSWRFGGEPEDLSASLHISGAPANPARSPDVLVAGGGLGPRALETSLKKALETGYTGG